MRTGRQAALVPSDHPLVDEPQVGARLHLLPRGHRHPRPAGLICHDPVKGFRFSVKPLRTGIQIEPMATPYARPLVVPGVLPIPAR